MSDVNKRQWQNRSREERLLSRNPRGEPLFNAQPFNLHFTSTHREVKAAVEYLFSEAVYKKNGLGLSKMLETIAAVLLNVLSAHENDPERFVRFSLRQPRYAYNRYNNLKISLAEIKCMVDALDNTFLETHKGIPGFAGGQQRVRIIRTKNYA